MYFNSKTETSMFLENEIPFIHLHIPIQSFSVEFLRDVEFFRYLFYTQIFIWTFLESIIYFYFISTILKSFHFKPYWFGSWSFCSFAWKYFKAQLLNKRAEKFYTQIIRMPKFSVHSQYIKDFKIKVIYNINSVPKSYFEKVDVRKIKLCILVCKVWFASKLLTKLILSLMGF